MEKKGARGTNEWKNDHFVGKKCGNALSAARSPLNGSAALPPRLHMHAVLFAPRWHRQAVAQAYQARNPAYHQLFRTSPPTVAHAELARVYDGNGSILRWCF